MKRATMADGATHTVPVHRKNGETAYEHENHEIAEETEDSMPGGGSSKKCAIVSIKEAPAYMRGNIYIWTGYRVNYTWKATFLSLFSLHNETWNIWTHFIGLWLFVGLTFYALNTWLADGTFVDKAMFLAWALAAQWQNFASTFFHWFSCINLPTWKLGCKLDYMAISVLVVGSMWPVFHYVFYCHPYWKWVYIGVMTAFGIGSIFFAWHPYFQTPDYQILRAVTFIGMALLPLLAGPHIMMHISLEDLFSPGWRLLMMGGCYIFGAYIYASHVPERHFPGKFDCSCCSHVIWHCFTIAAALWHYSALQTFHYIQKYYKGECIDYVME